MGTTFSIILYGPDPVTMEAAIGAAFDEVRRIEAMLSPYRPESELSAVNRGASTGPVTISPEFCQLLTQCQEYSRQSDGAFDISLGALIKAWGFFRGTGREPEPSEVDAALARVGYSHLELDPEAATLRFDCPGLELHPGGIGKGYAVDRIVELLRQRGFDTALVAGAGSSIYGLGAPPAEPRGWRVLINASDHPREPAAELFLKDLAVSTSGGHEKRFHSRGRIFSHLLDPRTGYPVAERPAVSVIAPRTLDSEAWTKPCFIRGGDWAASRMPADVHMFGGSN
jgi:thiamine biosynthesis lipoprotein